jgi:hypothetical protein
METFWRPCSVSLDAHGVLELQSVTTKLVHKHTSTPQCMVQRLVAVEQLLYGTAVEWPPAHLGACGTLQAPAEVWRLCMHEGPCMTA